MTFINSKFLLRGCLIKNMLKLQNIEAIGILEHWLKWQNAKEILIFEFKAWKNHTSDILRIEYVDVIDSKAGLYDKKKAKPVPPLLVSKGKVAPRLHTKYWLPIENKDHTTRENYLLSLFSTL